MAAYSYKALDAEGRVLKGMLDGDSERQVRSLLRGRRLRPIEVVESAGAARGATSLARPAGSGIGLQDLALFTRQLAILLRSGVPLEEALAAAARQAGKPRVKAMLMRLRGDVVEGRSLAAALGGFGRVFDDMYRAMVRAGEHSGYLDQVLEALADYTENRRHTRQKLLGALLYPLVLALVALVVVSLLMVFVVPELVGLFAHSGVELPLLTRILITVSGFLAAWWPLLLAGLVLAVLGLRRLLARRAARRAWHALLLRLPLAGSLAAAVDTARFASTLSILVASGVPLLEGLRIAGAVMRNLPLQEASLAAAEAVQEGGSLHRALEDSGLFPPLLVQMVASGEASGELQAMLARAARNQERELEGALGALMNLAEPLIIVLMAAVVGAIVMAVLLPIFEMNSLVA